jgi:hypothetical protein
MKSYSGPIAEAGVTVAFVSGSPFIEGFSRETEMPAGPSRASGFFVGLPDDLQTPGNHSVLFTF